MASDKGTAVATAVMENIIKLDDRYPGYREELAKRVLAVLRQRNSQPGEAGRRKALLDEVRSLADLVGSKSGDGR